MAATAIGIAHEHSVVVGVGLLAGTSTDSD
jgi:hypothetical protein